MNELDLGGEWTLWKDGEPVCRAIVPGCVHEDLLRAGLIDDPFVGKNEDTVRWVYQKNWTFKRDFQVSESFLQSPRVLLRCEGLDTIARIFINGKFLAATENMFRCWEFAVGEFLIAGINQIEIQMDSPLDYIEQQQAIRPLRYPSAPHQVPAFSQIRKAAYHFGWDWGPCLPSSGIWQPISLQAYDDARLRHVGIGQTHEESGGVQLKIDVEVENDTSANAIVSAAVTLDGHLVCEYALPLLGSKVTLDLSIGDPKLWWPRGMGAQPLYEVHVELGTAQGRRIDARKIRIGLRTFSLNLAPDAHGHAFAFSVNRVPFFAKGTNWIPADSFVTRVSADRYRNLLTSAADANMNMIRVWGGGIYEADVFYELCDELGLCVWQDFMFACAPYPLDQVRFIENATIEMEQQIRRLRHHACIALWCGNNELEMCGFVSNTGDDFHMALSDYRAFFVEAIPALLKDLSPEASYWPGSPYKEPGDVYNPDVWIDSPTKGDAHIWSICHQKEGFEGYRNCHHRFISEFGFQSFPEPTTASPYFGETPSFESPVVLHRQRSPDGNAMLKRYMLSWFRQPRDFESAIWCSQILQGLAIKYACEHWRRSSPVTMGSLIWQLNDAWPGISWSGIDYFGRWKAMHHMARRFYSPLLISGVEDLNSGKVAIYVTNDHRGGVVGVVGWRLADTHGHLISHGRLEVNVLPSGNIRCAEPDFSESLSRYGVENLMLWLEISSNQGQSTNLVLFEKPKKLTLQDPGLSWEIEPAEEGAFTVTVRAEKPALWVWLEIPQISLKCSDSFLHLEAESSASIRVTPEHSMALEQFTRSLRARSLYDTYERLS